MRRARREYDKLGIGCIIRYQSARPFGTFLKGSIVGSTPTTVRLQIHFDRRIHSFFMILWGQASCQLGPVTRPTVRYVCLGMHDFCMISSLVLSAQKQPRTKMAGWPRRGCGRRGRGSALMPNIVLRPPTACNSPGKKTVWGPNSSKTMVIHGTIKWTPASPSGGRS